MNTESEKKAAAGLPSNGAQEVYVETGKERRKRGPKVAKEVAEQEIEDWLDRIRYDDEEREEQQENINKLVRAVMGGHLEFKNDEKAGGLVMVQRLRFPIEKRSTEGQVTGQTETITYKNRIIERQVEPFKKGVKLDDGEGLVLAYTQALTGVSKGILKLFNTRDMNLTKSITLFFI